MLLVVDDLLDVLAVGVELWPQVQIMEESVAFMADVDEACVESGHKFPHPGKVDVAHVEAGRLLLFLVFDEAFVLGQGNGDLLGLYVYDYFTGHDG